MSWLSWLVVLSWACTGSLARAQQTGQAPAVTTVVDPCVPVDPEQFDRVLAIELGTSIDYRDSDAPPPSLTRVQLSCSEQGIELRLQDDVTRKSMVRVLDISRIEPASRTRLLALSVAEFVVASWVELRIADRPAVEPAGPAPNPAAQQAAAGVARRHVVAEPEPGPRVDRSEPSAPWELFGVFRLEGWSGDPGLMPVAALRVGQRPIGNVAFTVGADFGATRMSVDLGQVDLGTTSVMGALLFVVRTPRAELYAGGGGRFGFVHMSGVASDARVRGRSFVVPYGGALMLGRVAYHITGGLRLIAEIEGGIVTLPAEGRSGPRLVVDLSGAWLSAGAGVGWSF